MTECIMAMDGLVIQTRQPKKSEVTSISSYRNRKCCWGLVILAGCDARCKFNYFKPNNSGGTNDCTAWNHSKLKEFVENGHLPPQYYIIGDEGFVNTNQFLTPWSGTSIGRERDSFNFHLSSMRQCIERAFGMYVRRWGILWRPLEIQFSRWCTILLVCAKLHNYCIDNSPHIAVRFTEDNQKGDSEACSFFNDDANVDSDDAFMPRAARKTRQRITEQLDIGGYYRPELATTNDDVHVEKVWRNLVANYS